MAADHTKALPGESGMNVTVVTPRGELTRQKVTTVAAHGSLGDFEVLPGHLPYLTRLGTGVLTLGEGGKLSVYAHGPGYLEVGAMSEVKVLVNQATTADEVDSAAARAELQEAEAALKEHPDTEGADWKSAHARKLWAEAQLAAATRN